MSKSAVLLRKAKLSDAELVFKWRNHKSVRSQSFCDEHIDLASHIAWFKRSLASDQRCILIGFCHDCPFGVIRFDLVSGNRALINIFLDPDQQGCGLGSKLLEAGIEHAKNHYQIEVLDAEILLDNLASKSLFERQGFALISQRYRKTV